MGLKEERGTGTLYVMENGEYREIGNGIMPLTTILTTENGTISVPIEIERNAELSVSLAMDSDAAIRWQKFFRMLRLAEKRCRSRKRFVKLVMGQNFDRDSANNLANLARRNGMSWQRAWRDFCMMWVI